MSKRFKRVMVTGGAGYVGSNLVPKLLAEGYQVTVLDLYIYGDVFADIASNPNLIEVKGDLRNPSAGAIVGNDLKVGLGIQSVYEIRNVSAAVESRTADLALQQLAVKASQ